MRNLPKIDLNATNDCNFRCHHCCFKSGELKMSELSYEKIEKCLNEFKELGGQRIDITGGEPLMRPDIIKIIKLSKKLGLKTELVTNGSLLTETVLKKLKEIKLDGIAISLDGYNFETYSKIRQTDEKAFNGVLENISSSVCLGFYTKINTVVFEMNLDEIYDIAKLAIALGVNEHGLYYFSPIGRGYTSGIETANPIAWLDIIRNKLTRLKNKIKFSIETPIVEKEISPRLNIECFLKDPWHIQILPDGNVYPCAIMAAYQKPIANLRKNSIKEIWNNEKLWSGSYQKEVAPLFEKFGGCVNYPFFSHLINPVRNSSFQLSQESSIRKSISGEVSNGVKSGQFEFVCLCRKFKIEELMK